MTHNISAIQLIMIQVACRFCQICLEYLQDSVYQLHCNSLWLSYGLFLNCNSEKESRATKSAAGVGVGFIRFSITILHYASCNVRLLFNPAELNFSLVQDESEGSSKSIRNPKQGYMAVGNATSLKLFEMTDTRLITIC